MSEPTTGEWTGYIVDSMLGDGGAKGVADAHNAALAEREKASNAAENCMSLSKLLYAERVKVAEVKRLAEGNITACGTCHTILETLVKQ